MENRISAIFFSLLGFVLMSILMFLLMNADRSNVEMLTFIFIGGGVLFFIMFGVGLETGDKKLVYIILIAYLLRILAGTYESYIGRIPYAGLDTVAFNISAWYMANGITAGLSWEFYTKVIAFFYKIYGFTKVYAVFINVILGTLSVFLVYKISIIFVTRKLARYATIVATLNLNLIFLSGCLLRETFIFFFTNLYIYSFCKWRYERKNSMIIVTFFSLFCAMKFHMGMVFLLVSFFISIKNIRLKKTYKLAIFIFLIFILAILYPKISQRFYLNSSDQLYEALNYTEADLGSGYLNNVNYGSPLDIIFFLPLKLFYFMCSPTIFQMDSFYKVVAFFLDALPHTIILLYILKNYKKMKETRFKRIIDELLLLYLICIIPFAMGTIAAGTAIRHRNKFVGLLSIIVVIFYSGIREKTIRKRGKYNEDITIK